MDPEYGDYGGGYYPRNGETSSSVHYARFLGSRRMTADEPSPGDVMREIKMVINDYRVTRSKPRKYSLGISPTDVLIRELDTFHDERILTKYIHYCIHDDDLKHIFAFVAWSQSQSLFILHIFYCDVISEAANLKAAFAKGFQAAYKDWKAEARPSRRHMPPARDVGRDAGRDAYSEYAPPARLTRGALDHHRRSYEAPAVLEREQYRPPARMASRQRPRQRPAQGPRPNQLIEVYGDPRQGGYDYDDDYDEDFLVDAPPAPRPAVEKEVVYTRETFPPPTFGGEMYERRNGMRGGGRAPAYEDDVYASRRAGYGDRGGRRSRRYVDNGYARDDMLF